MGDFLYLGERNAVINLDQVICVTFDGTEQGPAACVSFANTEKDEIFGRADTESLMVRLGLDSKMIMAKIKKHEEAKPPLAFLRRNARG